MATSRAGLASLILGLFATLAGVGLDRLAGFGPTFEGVVASRALAKFLLVAAAVLVVYGAYRLTADAVVRRAESKQRAHTLRNVLRFFFSAVGLIAVLGAATEQWVGVLFSLGVIGFAITFALQQPLLSLLGWIYIVIKHPYGVGDRVRIGDARGDVIDVDFLVTTLWEVQSRNILAHIYSDGEFHSLCVSELVEDWHSPTHRY